MGLQIRTYVDGNQEFIDLYGNENIDIEISFAEIQDITKKNSAFTKEFKVPGTKNNNNIFNYFFDINAVALSWNPKRKFEADLLYDGYELYNGYVRMNAVTINKLETIYSVTFYSAVGDLASNIGDKGLCELDTSSLNHSLYIYNTAYSMFFDPSLQDMRAVVSGSNFYNEFYGPISTGDVQYIIGQRGYDYTGTTFGTIRDIDTFQTPLLDFSGRTGFFDNQATPIIPPYLIPSIRTKKLYELIVNQAGYQIDSTFFETDYFKRYYLPLSFNTDSVFMSQSKDWYLEAFNSSGTTGGGDTFSVYDSIFGVGNRYVFRSEQIIQDNLAFNPINVNDYQPEDGIDGPLGLSQSKQYLYAIPQPYSTVQQLELTVEWVYTGATGGISQQAGVVYLDALNGYFTGSSLFDVTTYSQTAIDVDDFMTSGTLVVSANTFALQTFNQTVFVMVSFTRDLPELEILNVQVKSVNLQQQLPFTIELYKEMSCEFKQIEFLQNINRTFNLVVVEHPVKPKTLIIEPIVNYIGKGRLLDWTDKVDYNSPQTLRPTTSLINGSIFLANKQDKDFVNTQYNTKSNKIFGQNIIDLGVDYKNATTNLVQTLGQNTDYYLNASGTTNFALPCYFISKESNVNGRTVFEYRPFRSLPRQIFKSVPLLSGNTGQRGYFQRFAGTSYDPNITNWTYNPVGLELINSVQNVNRLTTYPFLISGFSHYTIYDSSNTFTPDELIYPEADTMYDRYYRDYIDDLTSEENKIYSCKMQLNPWDVSQLYFDETILIKNAKFRINKISNLSLTDDNSLSDVELVKLTLDYTPTPTLFFDLVSCDDPCDIIHSNTDINYLLWAFGLPTIQTTGTTTGKIIKALTDFDNDQSRPFKKYKVVQTEYNPDYEYTNVFFEYGNAYINTGFTNYVMYNSCSATTLSSTLDVVSSLTGITSSGCLTVDVTNTGYSRSTFFFTNCSGSTSSWTLDPGATISVCGLWGTFTGTNYQFCPDFTNEVCIETPLPTPTPTVTPGLSPTPTPSVTPTHTTTATLTPTPSTTPLFQCFIAKTINVTTAGWLKYTTCAGVTQYEYKAVGNHQINVCIREGSLLPGIPFAQLAVFTETSGGVPC